MKSMLGGLESSVLLAAEKGSGSGAASSAKAPRFTAAPFIEDCVPDPNNVDPPAMFSGFVGRAADEQHTRFYFSLDLRSWCDMPTEAIRSAAPSQDGTPGLYTVWFAHDVEVIACAAGHQPQHGCFFIRATEVKPNN